MNEPIDLFSPKYYDGVRRPLHLAETLPGWAYTSERSQRLWDEMVPVPTRAVSVRLTVTYAGFEGESGLLEGLYKRGLQGQEIAPSDRKSVV